MNRRRPAWLEGLAATRGMAFRPHARGGVGGASSAHLVSSNIRADRGTPMHARIVCYRLEPNVGIRSLSMPVHSVVLAATYHNGAVGLWVRTPDPELPAGLQLETRRFELAETGKPFDISPDVGVRYLGTCAAPGGTFVMHIFERIETVESER